MKPNKTSLILSFTLLTALFVFMKHYIELAVSVEVWMLSKGLMLHKDFVAFHFPLVRFLLLPIHQFFNWDFRIEPFLGLATGIATLFVIYIFGKKYLSRPSTAISLLFFTVFFWFYATGISFYHEMVIGFLLAISAYFLFEKRFFLLGITLALAELSGQVATPTIAAFVIIALFQLKKIKKILPLLYGLAIPTTLMVLYYFYKGAINEFWKWNVTYYLTYAGYSKNIPINQIPEIIASYLPLAGAGLALKHRKLLIFSILSISTIPFNFFSVFHFHHFSFSLPILALTAGALFDSSPKVFKPTAILFLIITILAIIPWYKNRIIFPPSFKIANDVTTGDNMDKTVQWIKKNTKLTDTLMVFGDSLFYVRSNRLPSTRASAGMPYAWEPFGGVKGEIENNLPNYWIIDEQFKNRFVKNYNKKDMLDFMENELSRCFKLVKEFPLWQVWLKTCE